MSNAQMNPYEQIDCLETENAALRAEVEQLRMALADTEALELGTAERCHRWRESYKMQEQQLAAAQLEAKRLRDAIFDMAGEEPAHSWKLAKEIEALSSPTSTDALDAYVAEKVKECSESERKVSDAYLRIRELVGAWRTPDAPTPEQVYEHTEQCVGRLARQRDLAVSAIENLVKQKGRHNTEIAYKKLVEALAAIKESEG